jgi:hypothetical protein
MTESITPSTAHTALTLTLSQRERGYKRRAFKLLLFLLALLVGGAIINVAVAWACAYWLNTFEHGGAGIQGAMIDANLKRWECWSLTRRDAFGASRVIVMPDGGQAKSIISATNEAKFFPAWCQLRALMDVRLAESNALAISKGTPDRPNPVILVEDARGWPMLSLTCTWDGFVPDITPTHPPNWSLVKTGIELPIYGGTANRGGLDYARAFPLQIWWPGFAINTIFYAAVLWVVLAVPLKVRKWRRIKRGQCASCGYSLRGTPNIEKCPEGGATVAHESTA